jgi:hypothetical protein
VRQNGSTTKSVFYCKQETETIKNIPHKTPSIYDNKNHNCYATEELNIDIQIFWEAVGLEWGPLSLVSTRKYNWGATWKK